MEHPKVFISYSWHPEKFKIKVQQLADRLSGDGVHVVIDIWDLLDGQDKNAFMEKMVNDPTISKVLLICTEEYAKKANDRKGGVGIESTIVSSEVYGQVNQTKFIPVIFEKDENGNAYCPTYVKSRTYVDLSEETVFENGYDQLLRDIYNKPTTKRPPIGDMPEYLKEDLPVLLPTSQKISMIKRSIENNDKYLEAHLSDFKSTFVSSLSNYKIDIANVDSKNIVQQVEKTIEEMQPLLNDFVSFVKLASIYNLCSYDYYIDFFEAILQFYSENDVDLNTERAINYMVNDNYRYFNYQLFLYFATLMVKYERFDILSEVLKTHFIITSNSYYKAVINCDFTDFNKYNYTLDYFKKRETNRVSIVADMIKHHAAAILNFTEIVKIDILLFYMSYYYEHSKENDMIPHHWYPTLSIYNHQIEVLPKIVSMRYFSKVKKLFNVKSIEEFKSRISSIKDPRQEYHDGYHNIPSIMSGLSIDNAGSLD